MSKNCFERVVSSCRSFFTSATSLCGFVFLMSSVFCTASVRAQVIFPIEAPSPKIGQIATFRTVDLWTNKELRVSTTELVAIEADGFVVRTNSSDRETVRTARSDKSWNFCNSMRDSDKPSCEGHLQFPMQIGSKHTVTQRPWDSGQGYDSSTCETKADEKVTTPAGSYDTVKIVCTGLWKRVFDGYGTGLFNQTIWYAPAIGRPVKFQTNHFLSNGRLDNKTQAELVSFTAGN